MGRCFSRTSLIGLLVICPAVLLQFFMNTAYAHPVAQGSVKIIRDDNSLSITFKVSTEQIAVWNSYNTDDLEDKDEAILNAHARYLREHLKLRVADKIIEIPEIKTKAGSAPELSMREFSLTINHPKERSACWPNCTVEIYQDFLHEFQYAPGNQWEAIFTVEESGAGTPLLLRSMQWLMVPDYGTKSTLRDTFKVFFAQGLHHIMAGYDHLLFVSALVLGAATFWRIVLAVSFFTLAHTITLVLSVLRMVVFPPEIVEPIIAASIVIVALLNFSNRSRMISYLPAFCFGLFHGLGFARGLIESLADIPNVVLTTALLGFSIGIEVGHQIVIIALFTVFYFISIILKYNGQEIAPAGLRKIMSVAIALAGMFYFITAIGYRIP